jgi:hypothetical protein
MAFVADMTSIPIMCRPMWLIEERRVVYDVGEEYCEFHVMIDSGDINVASMMSLRSAWVIDDVSYSIEEFSWVHVKR